VLLNTNMKTLFRKGSLQMKYNMILTEEFPRKILNGVAMANKY
jgi:hypothetical protein